MSVLLDLKSEVNTIYPTFAIKLNFLIELTNVGALKINGIILDTYKMVIIVFLVNDKANRVKFFKETFLIANVSWEVVFRIFFLI